MKTEMTLDEAILHCEEVANRCDGEGAVNHRLEGLEVKANDIGENNGD